jgi:hypothetical protein
VLGRRLTDAEVSAYGVILAAARARKVRVVGFPVLPPRATAMTVDTVILVRPQGRDDAVLLAHELVHVRQWGELGVVGFLRRYVAAYVRNLVRLRRHHDAYLAIPLESQAREEARQWRSHPPA